MVLRAVTVLAAAAVFLPIRLADDGWDDILKKSIERYESIQKPEPTAYPWVAKRLRTFSEVKGFGHIQVFAEVQGKRSLASDVYYTKGQLHIVCHDEGWNLATKEDGIYEWMQGDTKGIITKATDRDLIDYLLYLTDPSYIMTCLYHEALQTPGTFLPQKELEGGIVEWRLRTPIEGFQAVLVSQEPAWLCGFEYRNPATGQVSRLIYTKPKSLNQLPPEVLDRMTGITFEKSDLSIRRHMVYL
jgi:hypothetical protein